MTVRRVARCRCGQLTATCVEQPVRVSICHCRACQRRTGGPFSAQARFPIENVSIDGQFRVWERLADSGRKAWYRWCVGCGGTIAYVNEGVEELVAVPLGAFADDTGDEPLPALTSSVFESEKQPWLRIEGDGIIHQD